MTPKIKKRLLRTVLVMRLSVSGCFFLTQTKQPPWWVWLFPIPILLTVYEIVLRGSRCSTCRQDFALKEASRTPGLALGGGRVEMVCMFCGEKESHRIGTGH